MIAANKARRWWILLLHAVVHGFVCQIVYQVDWMVAHTKMAVEIALLAVTQVMQKKGLITL